MCVVKCLDANLDRTKVWRDGKNPLLLSLIEPHKEVCSSSISCWLKDTLALQHDLAPRIYVLHKITIALKFMSYMNLKLRLGHQTPLNLCLT